MSKLVRDNIPEIIEADTGETPSYQTIGDDELFLDALLNKLIEEIEELDIAITEGKEKEEIIDELADVMTVLEAVASSQDIFWIEVRKRSAVKFRERGGFDRRVWLISDDVDET